MPPKIPSIFSNPNISSSSSSSSSSETKQHYAMIPFISSHLMKMAADCSKIYHHAPPLLRAFNLSNQPFSLPHNNKDAIFSHHSSVILTKSPSFPPLSFLPKKPSFSHFPSMASSVARMPSDEWRHHHPYLFCHLHTHNPISPKTSQPVSADSFSFDRESFPNSSAATSVAADILPTARPSSLMQMWRELVVKAGLCPTPRTSTVTTSPAAAAEESTDCSDACEESNLSAKEIMGTAPAAALLPSPEPLPTPSPMPDTGHRRKNVESKEKAGAERIHEAGGRMPTSGRRFCRAPPSSQFPFRAGILILIRLRPLRQSEIFETESNNFFLRETHEDESQGDINEVPAAESMAEMEVQSSNSLLYVLTVTIDHSDAKNNGLLELISTREIEYSPEAFYSLQAFYTSPSQYEDQHESQSFHAVWDERSLWGNSGDWQKPVDSHMLQTLLVEVSSDGTETSNEEKIVASGEGYWFLQPFNS